MNLAYFLFVKILNETKKIAIGKVVLREKEHLVAKAYQRSRCHATAKISI